MPNSTRRIVTGRDTHGRAIVLHDTSASVFHPKNRPGVEVTHLWITTETPASLADATDRTQGPVALIPPAQGTVFRIVRVFAGKGLDRSARSQGAARGELCLIWGGAGAG